MYTPFKDEMTVVDYIVGTLTVLMVVLWPLWMPVAVAYLL